MTKLCLKLMNGKLFRKACGPHPRRICRLWTSAYAVISRAMPTTIIHSLWMNLRTTSRNSLPTFYPYLTLQAATSPACSVVHSCVYKMSVINFNTFRNKSIHSTSFQTKMHVTTNFYATSPTLPKINNSVKGFHLKRPPCRKTNCGDCLVKERDFG